MDVERTAETEREVLRERERRGMRSMSTKNHDLECGQVEKGKRRIPGLGNNENG